MDLWKPRPTRKKQENCANFKKKWRGVADMTEIYENKMQNILRVESQLNGPQSVV